MNETIEDVLRQAENLLQRASTEIADLRVSISQTPDWDGGQGTAEGVRYAVENQSQAFEQHMLPDITASLRRAAVMAASATATLRERNH